ncbi:MAG TPA: hypothetical protein VE972_02225 [Conexibacter sp.]|nr:hypothetical protein [Conexibacter sp.]
MPALPLGPTVLASFGAQWTANGGALSRTPPNSSIQLGGAIDGAVASSFATMLGGVPVVQASQKKATRLYPPQPDCVETAPVTVVGGIRKQNYDVVYRPDGVRFAFDSKTLNDSKSVGKNWQNMVNDLATEAATIHTRFPMAVVAFLVLIPLPAVGNSLDPITWRLDGLGGRKDEHAPAHVAEAMCFATWDPLTGDISPATPDPARHPKLRIEHFSSQVEEAYRLRYAGSPPH